MINYVFETPESLTDLCNRLEGLAGDIHTIRLVASNGAIQARVRAREDVPERESELASYLRRYKALVAIQTAAAKRGDMGDVIDTTGILPDEVADLIRSRL